MTGFTEQLLSDKGTLIILYDNDGVHRTVTIWVRESKNSNNCWIQISGKITIPRSSSKCPKMETYYEVTPPLYYSS